MDTAPGVFYEFGPFRIDPDRGHLLRDGRPIAITPKAFEVLLALVRRSHQTVSKDELMQAVWPNSVVEEANLSQCVFVLRKLLGDTHEERRYIVTLPGRGYRFAAVVGTVAKDEGAEATPNRMTMGTDVAMAPSADRTQSSRPTRWNRRWGFALAGAVVAIAVVCGLVFLLWRPVGAPRAEAVPVLVADFANTTGEPVFDATLRQGLAVQLQQSPALSLISEDRVQRALGLMGRSSDAALTPRIAREVCERVDGAIVLEGSIAKLGGAYVLGLEARDCRTGDVQDVEQVQETRKEGVLKALDAMAGGFRQHVGESVAAIARHNTPLAEATTPSLEALKAYSEAVRVQASSGSAAALPLFQHAVAIDPQFAMAHAQLGRVYGDLGASALSAESTRRAWQLRQRTSDAERFFIDASYQLQVTGNLQAAQQTCESWARTYPAAAVPHAFLGGIVYPVAGQFPKALAEATKVVAMDPDFATGYLILAYDQVYLGAFPAAEAVLRRAVRRKLATFEFALLEYDLAFLRSDFALMKRVASDPSVAEAQDWLAYHRSLASAFAGRMSEARHLSAQAVVLATQGSQNEKTALFEAGAAVREAFFGNAPLAREHAGEAMRLSNDRDAEFGAAFAFAMDNDAAQATRLADDLETRYPDDTSVRFSYLPAVRAQLALRRGDPAAALQLLQTAEPYDNGMPRSSMHGMFGAMYTVYTRGEAYLAQRHGAQAALEFRRIVEHPGLVVSDPVGALARLQLARAYVAEGDIARAKAAYRGLLGVWKNADPDLPLVKQAAAESAKLH